MPFKGEVLHLGPLALHRKGMAAKNFTFQSWQSFLLGSLCIGIGLLAGIHWSSCFSAKTALQPDAVEE